MPKSVNRAAVAWVVPNAINAANERQAARGDSDSIVMFFNIIALYISVSKYLKTNDFNLQIKLALTKILAIINNLLASPKIHHPHFKQELFADCEGSVISD